MRPLIGALLLLAACTVDSSDPGSHQSQQSDRPGTGLERMAPVLGLPFNDPCLRPVLAELTNHPEWLDAPLVDPVVLALVPGVEHVCLALRGTNASDVFVSVAPDNPWSVATVGLDRGIDGREFTYDPDELADDSCTFTAFGRAEPSRGHHRPTRST